MDRLTKLPDELLSVIFESVGAAEGPLVARRLCRRTRAVFLHDVCTRLDREALPHWAVDEAIASMVAGVEKEEIDARRHDNLSLAFASVGSCYGIERVKEAGIKLCKEITSVAAFHGHVAVLQVMMTMRCWRTIACVDPIADV
jgi:hypothetical protein